MRFEVNLSEKSIFFIIFLSLVIFSFSQDSLVHHYTESNGLPSSSVSDVTQDHWGRMWFATRSGIAVYDGVHWEKYSTAEGLPVSYYLKIRADRRGRIWAISNPDYARFHVVYHDISHKRKWELLPKPPIETNQEREVTSFDLTEEKQENQQFIAIGTKHAGVFIWNGRQWEGWAQKNGLLSDTVNDLIGLEGKFYAATDKGLSVVVVQKNGETRLDNRLNAVLKANIPTKSPIKIKAINVERCDRYANSPLTHHRIWLYGVQWLGYFMAYGVRQVIYSFFIQVFE
jgi:ligand-binding sensor domain-containing protein